MTRNDYFNNPSAPKPNSLVPAASAIVTDKHGNILLERRSDNNLWALPGGVMELGESISQTIIREVKEETGLDIAIDYVVGIYSDPNHIIAFSDGEVRQEFSICFACKIVGGTIHSNEESLEIALFKPWDIKDLSMTQSTRLRIEHYLAELPQSYIG